MKNLNIRINSIMDSRFSANPLDWRDLAEGGRGNDSVLGGVCVLPGLFF